MHRNLRFRVLSLFANLVILILSIILAFLIAEAGLRIQKKEGLAIKDFRQIERALFEKAYPADHDPVLGWVPKAGFSGDKNIWGTKVSITEDGVRSNGEGAPADLVNPRLILAVGDSFTFGDGVSDDETWPAILESMLKRPVINGGVFGYGLDQSYLRSKKLIQKYRPEIFIFSFIPDNVNRCELSRRNGTDKPYFNIADNKLILKNVPVPPPALVMETDRFRKIGGYSFLVHRIMSKRRPEYWLAKKKYNWGSKAEHSNGRQVAGLLLKDLDAFARANGVKRSYLLIQYTDGTTAGEYGSVQYVLDYLSKPPAASFVIVDLDSALEGVKKDDYERYASFYSTHMNKKGNRFVAERMADAMKKEGDAE